MLIICDAVLRSQFWLAYLADPSDSGKIHNDVKIRWLNGDGPSHCYRAVFSENSKIGMRSQSYPMDSDAALNALHGRAVRE